MSAVGNACCARREPQRLFPVELYFDRLNAPHFIWCFVLNGGFLWNSEGIGAIEIPMIIGLHDSVCDGIFQNQFCWGVLEADEKDEARILELIKELMPE